MEINIDIVSALVYCVAVEATGSIFDAIPFTLDCLNHEEKE